MLRPRQSVRGFTLIEVVITVAIVGLLASAALPLASTAIRREKESDLRIALRQIRTAIDDYKDAVARGRVMVDVDKSGYPATLSLLYEGVEDATSPEHVKIYFLRQLPRDPMYPDASATPEQTWGLRSYASPPEDPQPGDDVFDVYSLAGGKGLNGIPYHDW